MAKRVYQLKATLVGIKPPVWRRIVVPETMTLAELHNTMQAAFGWWDDHLHEFEIDGVRYGVVDGGGWGRPPVDERRTRLGRVARRGSTFEYLYDFGDGWRHRITVEKVAPIEAGVRYPICVAGGRACPPEDCGGPWGYENLLEAISNPAHPDHESMLEWVDESFDPERFEAPGVLDRVAVRL